MISVLPNISGGGGKTAYVHVTVHAKHASNLDNAFVLLVSLPRE